jgi:hypothetical protein
MDDTRVLYTWIWPLKQKQMVTLSQVQECVLTENGPTRMGGARGGGTPRLVTNLRRQADESDFRGMARCGGL